MKNENLSRRDSAKADSAHDRARLAEKVMGAFEGEIQPVRAPLTYRLGLILVTVVMVLLPVIYLAIIGLVAYAVYLHLITNTGLLSFGRGRSRLFFLLAYLSPLIVGGILVLFMFKPLLSRPARRPDREPLSPAEEPLLFAFVERICRLLRAPVPKRIEADWQVNASAGFRRGFVSMLSNDLVLTIGLPLAAGLSLRQFAGVLAHEFGHFSQGGAMRLTYIIRSINHWFERVVFERDEWDEAIVRWSKQLDVRLGWIAYLARFFVWLTRKILHGLMLLGHGVSSFMMRQMEFDADRNQTRLVGSNVFETTMRRLLPLQLAFQGAQSNLGNFYREGRLGDNLPQLVNHNFNQFAPEAFQKINRKVDEGKTGLFDTHPATGERIARARQEDTPGIFHLDLPTAVLFSDFDAQCERVTWEFYRQIFGDALETDQIHPNEELLQRQEAEQADFQALNRYMQGSFVPDRALLWPEQPSDPVERATLQRQIEDSRRHITSATTAYLTTHERYTKVAAKGRAQLAPKELAQFEAHIGQRLDAAIELAGLLASSGQDETAATWQAEFEALRPPLRLLNDNVAPLVALRNENARLVVLFQQLSQERDSGELLAAVRRQAQALYDATRSIRRSLEAVPYPFDHAAGEINVGQFVLSNLPDPNRPGDIYNAANTLFGDATRLRARILGRLCLLAEQVESALGLEPLPEPVAEAAAVGQSSATDDS